MREIKFRGKCRSKDRWEVGELLDYNDPIPVIYDEEVHFPVYSETIGQYTGVKDSNGVEIYEDDILKVTTPEEYTPNYDCAGGIVDYDIKEGSVQLGVVSFNFGTFEYNESKALKGGSESLYNIPLSFLKNTEVVGNIHDNPELIKGE